MKWWLKKVSAFGSRIDLPLYAGFQALWSPIYGGPSLRTKKPPPLPDVTSTITLNQGEVFKEYPRQKEEFKERSEAKGRIDPRQKKTHTLIPPAIDYTVVWGYFDRRILWIQNWNSRAFDWLSFHHILREYNSNVDELSKEVLELQNGAFGFYKFP